jgi:hypothetical protein
MLRTVSISATIRRHAHTRQTPQSFGQRRQRHADGFIDLLELVQMDREAAVLATAQSVESPSRCGLIDITRPARPLHLKFIETRQKC